MKRPCENCPFRSDKPFRGLTKSRAKGIALSLRNDCLFPCHKTVDYNNTPDGRITDKSKACIGSAIFMENTASESGGCFANVQYRLRAMSGEFGYDDLESNDVPVYTSLSEFVKGAAK